MGYSPRGCKESDTTEHRHTHHVQIHRLTNKSSEVIAYHIVDAGDRGVQKTEKITALMDPLQIKRK